MNMIPEDDLQAMLRVRLASLGAAVSTLQPPESIEDALRAQLFRAAAHADPLPAPAGARPARRKSTPGERWAAWFAWPVSVAAAMGLCSWMVLTDPGIAPDRLSMQLAGDAAPAQSPAGAAATPFLALAPLADFPAGQRSEVVTATLPRATLAEFGLPVSPMRAAEPIGAEFLVGPHGNVLAVRFVGDAGL